MALGDAGNYNNGGNKSNKVFDQTYYSRIRIKNKDKLAVGFTFSKGLLKLEVSEEKDNYRFEPIASINISPTKAKLLIYQLEGFINRMKSGESIDPKEGVGINAGLGDTVSFIAFKTTGRKPEIPEHSFVVGKVSSSGVMDGVVEFVFNTDYDFSLCWSNVENMEVDKQYHQFMGIETILDVLKEFASSSSGAIGASVWDTGRYETNRILRKMDPIYEKLGIERKTNNVSSDNFFTRQNAMNPPEPSHSTKKTFDEIDDMLN